MGDLPSGLATFLLTDVVGSTRLWEAEPAAMAAAMVGHDQLVEATVKGSGGTLVRPRGEGDSRFAVFTSPAAALTAAACIVTQLAGRDWPTSVPVRVRTAIGTGEADLRAGDYYGDVVNRCARLRAAGHAGQVLVAESTALLLPSEVLPAGLGLLDLGVHRLKDLSRPDRIFQLTAPGLATDFPALRTLDRAKHNLPVQLSSFVGRDDDVLAVRELLQAHRLVTVTGFGGMGKTRLALQVGAQLADGDGDGVWFVDLSAETDPARLPAAIGAVLGIPQTVDDTEAELLRWCEERLLLLVLDNLEQIVGCAPFVARLLAATPHLRVLATSRTPLHIRGEREYPLAPLDLAGIGDGAGDDVETLSSYAAARLFIDRAVEARPDFTVTNRNAAAVAAICTRLDGHPLSIELAAARIRLLTPETLLARLDRALTVLTGPASGDRPERHRTLRATIAWSYDALGELEQRLLAALSVFPVSANLDAIDAVCSPSPQTGDVLDTLTVLVEASLVHVEDTEGGAESRFGLLASVREFAAEQLAGTGQSADLARRHAQHYAEVAARTAPALEGTADAATAVAALRRELPNLRAALTWARAFDLGVMLGLVGSLGMFFWLAGLLREGLSWVDMALSTADLNALDPRLADAYEAGAWLANYSFDLSLARDYAQGCARLRRALGDERGLGRALKEQAKAARNSGDLTVAEQLLSVAVELARRTGDEWNLAVALNNSGDLKLAHRDFSAAYALCTESLQLRQARGDEWGSAICGINLAWALMGMGRLDDARSQFRDTLHLSHRVGPALVFAECVMALGALETSRDVRRGAFLLGAADALIAATDETVLGHEATMREQAFEAIRAQLSVEEFDQLLHKGAAAALEDVITLALGRGASLPR